MSRLSDLDARLVPRLALALRALLDGVTRHRAGPARARGTASWRGALTRLDDRFVRSGPAVRPASRGASAEAVPVQSPGPGTTDLDVVSVATGPGGRGRAVAGAGPTTVALAGVDELAAVYALRHDVFVLGQGVPVELERDLLDAQADHAVALQDGAVVGTGRLVDGRIDVEGLLVPGTQGTVGTIGRMAVAERARGTGAGRALLDLLIATAAERGMPAVELHAQLHARGFYDRAGFTPFGEVYLEAGIEHQGMRRRL